MQTSTIDSDIKSNAQAAAPSARSQMPFLPQDRLLTVNENDIPLLTDLLVPGFSIKPLLVDKELGMTVTIGYGKPGTKVPAHYHTGAVHGFTLKGSWYYDEYPDQLQTPGSYLYEPAGSVHALSVPETNTEDTVVFFVLFGANIGFDEQGNIAGILDAVATQALIEATVERLGLGPIDYLTGGSVRHIGDK